MASRFLHDPKYALMYGLLALLLLLSGGLLFREAGQLRERAEGMATENQLLLSYRHAERDAAHLDLLSSLFQKAPASAYGKLLEEAGVSVEEIFMATNWPLMGLALPGPVRTVVTPASRASLAVFHKLSAALI